MTRWTSEEALVRAFQGCLNCEPSWAEGVFFSEVDTGEGVPDLILVRVPGLKRHEGAEALAALPAEPFLNGNGAVLAELQLRPHTVEYLAVRTGLTREHTLRAIRYLIRLGWATQNDRGLFMASSVRPFPQFEITAFEFKLKDTGRAIQQAIRYRQFAQKAIVVVPSQRLASLSSVSDLASKATLGTATFDMSDCTLKFSVKPRLRPPRSRHAHMHVLGRLIQHIELGDRTSRRRFPLQAVAKGNSVRLPS